MKPIILKFLYHRYRSFFYSFFVEEMIGEIPNKVSEPAMAFLGNGKEKMEKWILYWVSILQRRIATEKVDIEVNQGMILMLKILLREVLSQKPTNIQTRVTAEPVVKPDHAATLAETLKEYRESRKVK